ncbi:outer membrane lipoprotein-sorting protein [Candidatus Fermentibacterales bacterium]|nr:outer membrane lipoprotein-sorting protein [Candidatus Fermentibacterales bacterium]
MMLCSLPPFLLLTVALPVLSGVAVAQSPSADEIVDMLDRLYRSESSYAEISMEVVTPQWERTLSLLAWSEGMDKTYILVTEPPRERGLATLRLGDEMWNYLPNTNSVMRVPPSMMMGSWMGSDFTNDDLVRETSFREDYSFSLVDYDGEGSDDGYCYLEMVPGEDVPVVWGRVLCAVRQDELLPVWMRYFDEHGRLMREMSFSDYTDFGGRTIPAVTRLVPADEEGHRTTIRYTHVEFDLEIDPDVFSLRNLRSGAD